MGINILIQNLKYWQGYVNDFNAKMKSCIDHISHLVIHFRQYIKTKNLLLFTF